jgi:hypothetical protein
VTVTQRSNNGTSVVVAVSWSAVPDGGEPITGYTVTATGAFSGGSQETRVAGTSAELVVPCAGSTFCANGKLDVAVAAYNRFGAGDAGTASWTIRPAAVVTTTTTTTQPPPVVTTTTTTQPPVVITTTTTTPPPPPPPSLPSAGAVVISTVGRGAHLYEKKVTTAPPADWASHGGQCQVVNKTLEATAPIACSGGTVSIAVDIGGNLIVVRAYAASGSDYVDSQVRNTFVQEEPDENCGGGRICQPRSVPVSEDNQLVGGGIGLLATAWLLTVRNRRMRRESGE